MPNMSHGLDPVMQEVAKRFDDVCRSQGALYTIEQDTHNEQAYLIHGKTNIDTIASAMEDFIQHRWVRMEIKEGDGPFFKFTLKALYEYDDPVKMVDIDAIANVNDLDAISEKACGHWVTAFHAGMVIPPIVIKENNQIVKGAERAKALILVGGMRGKVPVMYEEQRKSATRHYSRRQAQFKSEFGPLRVFGRIVECEIGEEMKLVEPLTAYDNVTVIPKGATIEIVDNDPRLPDIKYDGNIINVSMEKLMKAAGKKGIAQKIDEAVTAIIPMSIMGVSTNASKPVEVDSDEESSNMHDDAMVHHEDASPIVITLNKLRAAEIVAALQYEVYSIMVPSLHMQGLETIFEEHMEEERKHAKTLAQRIHELEGTPVADPEEIKRLSPYQISYDTSAEGMVATLLEQERIGLDNYKKAIRQAQGDPATRLMLEEILREEEEHTTDMKSMLEDN